MIVESLTVAGLIDILKVITTIAGSLALLFGVFKMINWVKNKFININNNVIALEQSLTTNMQGLREDIKDQTHTLATELREQRQDFRTFYGPYIMHMNMQQQLQPATARAKKRTPAKAKKPTRKG